MPESRSCEFPALRLATTVVAAITALGCMAGAAGAITIAEVRPLIARQHLVADVTVADLFSPQIEGRLRRGQPVTLLISVDLWRARNGWFDKLLASGSLVYRVRYDSWDDRYELRRNRDDALAFADLEALMAHLSRAHRLALTPTRSLSQGHRYYLTVSGYLRPLTIEDLKDFDDQLARRVGRKPGLGTLTRLPRSVFSILTSISGLGDEIATHRTRVFRIPARAIPGEEEKP